MQFVQISDCHIGKTQNNINLKKIVQKLKELRIKTVIVSGDIAENGLLSEYLEFIYIMRDFKVFALAGNHDNGLNMQKVFLSRQLQNFSIADFNIQFIDSKVENKVSGYINTKNINHNLKNSIIITHHPIVKMNSKWDDDLSCENMDQVMNVIQDNSNIKTVCFGHAHEEKSFKKNHIDIYSCPSTAYQFDGNSKVGFNLYQLDKEITKTTIWV